MTEQGAAAKFNPVSIVKAAIKAVPAVKWALGIAGVAAALAIAATFFSDVTTTLVGIAAMLPLMVLLVVFARAADLKNEFRIPALFLTWAVLIIFVGSAVLLFSSVFFDWPKPTHDLVPFRGNVQNPHGSLPPSSGKGERQTITPDAEARVAKSMRPSVPVPTPIAPLNGTVFTHYPRATKLVWKGTEVPTAFLLEIQI